MEKFTTTIKARGRAKNTINNIDLTLGKAERWLKKPLETATFDDLMRYINYVKEYGFPVECEASRVINRKRGGLSKGSLHIIESKFIQFFSYCFNQTDEMRYNKIVRLLKDIRVNKPKTHVRPQDITLPEEAKMLINVATLERDRCLVASFFEGGMRLGEMLALDNDMVEINDAAQEVIFHIPNTDDDDEDEDNKAKTGPRSVLCVEVYSYVLNWLKCNPSDKFMPLSKSGVRKVIADLYKRAGINKPCNVHMLRHSAITYAAGLGMTDTELSYRFWGIPHSNMVATYVHMSEQTKAQGYRVKKGLAEPDIKVIINPLAARCVECGKLIQSGHLCKACQDSKKLLEENRELKKGHDDLKKEMEEQNIRMVAMNEMMETFARTITDPVIIEKARKKG